MYDFSYVMFFVVFVFHVWFLFQDYIFLISLYSFSVYPVIANYNVTLGQGQTFLKKAKLNKFVNVCEVEYVYTSEISSKD